MRKLPFLLFGALMLIFAFSSQIVRGQCSSCSITVVGNGAPSQTITSNSVICLSGARTSNLNFNNSSNITLCIASGASINSSLFQSLSGLSTVNNYGTFILSTDPNGNWTVNNYSTMTLSNNLNSNKTINTYSELSITGNRTIFGTINLAGSITSSGNLTVNSSGRISALNAYQCNSLSVTGTFTNNGVVTGNNQTVPGGLQTGLVVNKTPNNTSITGNAIVSSSSPSITCPSCGTSFTSNGTFYVPAGVTEITIETWGAGGKGGSRTSTGSGGGGGGGAYSRRTISVSPGEPLGIFVGVGATSTDPGGTTYVTRNSSDPISASVVFARGGNSVADNDQNGASGGAALSGSELTSRSNTVSFSGGAGANGLSGSYGGGGGSSAGTSSIGASGVGSAGGEAPVGGGNGGSGGTSNNSDGNSGATPGGGGGGARRQGGTRLGGNGSDGLVVISYTCPTQDSCSIITDYGTTGSGLTVIEYLCSGTWNAPEGLAEFEVAVVGGGGGGGVGTAAGGGGGGGVLQQSQSNINRDPIANVTYGLPSGTSFNITVGNGGYGAVNSQGGDGEPSSFTGSFINYSGNAVTYNFVSAGGGGGGSNFNNANRSGRPGGSGGGGAFEGSAGTGGNNNGQGNGNSGAQGRQSSSTRQGAGGGGAGSAGSQGTSSGGGIGQSNGGNGGNGVNLANISSTRFFGAGGGGTATGGSGQNNPGNGGSSNIGGRANVSGPGFSGVINTGSGGGAGSTEGGRGGSGIVIISFQNFRILPVEFLNFELNYQANQRLTQINWSTAQEWESSHFEIERALNSIAEWKTIGKVQSKGFSDAISNYSFDDLQLPASGGTLFYRIKQVDFDGKFSYSDTKAVKVESLPGAEAWIAFPNPSSSNQSLTLDLLEVGRYADEPIQVKISDSTGRDYSFTADNPEKVNSSLNRYFDGTRRGLFFVQITWGNQNQSIKLIRN